jgi:hypothetical protein
LRRAASISEKLLLLVVVALLAEEMSLRAIDIYVEI